MENTTKTPDNGTGLCPTKVKELQELIARKTLVETELIQLERDIYHEEGKYLTSTSKNPWNFVRGWGRDTNGLTLGQADQNESDEDDDQNYQSKALPMVMVNERVAIPTTDRIFSMSSTTYMNALDADVEYDYVAESDTSTSGSASSDEFWNETPPNSSKIAKS